MAKVIAAVVLIISLIAGVNIYLRSSSAELETFSVEQLSQRIVLLEEKIKEERESREELELAILQLSSSSGDASLMSFSSENFDEVEEEQIGLDVEDEESETPESRREAYLQRMQERNDPSRRIERLEQAGFANSQAAWILKKEKEIQFNRLDDRWERQRQAYLENPKSFDLISDNPIRAELGEQGYEKYLDANGRSTTVRVNQVLENSPAAYAGLQSGDQVLRYGGQRVFNFSELNTVTVQGEKGAPVVVDVLRNGSLVQLTVDRGPLGISSRRGRRGF